MKGTVDQITGQCGTCVKIMGLNVCGLHSKPQLSILEQYIQEADIVCLNETKTDTIDSCMYFSQFHTNCNGKKWKKHKYGGIHGLSVLVKNTYNKYSRNML